MTMQREWFEKDYYATLGVPSSATQKDITTAYRGLARKLHPDANPDDPAAEERFKEVSAAYDVISDPDRRKEYDKVRANVAVAGARSGGGGGFGRPDASFTGDIGDLLGNLFGRGDAPSWSPSGPFSRGPQRGVDLEADLHLSFADAIAGVTTTVNLISEAVCPDCHGNGAAPGTTPRVCTDCGGRGVLDDNQGYFSFSHPCTTCQGRGSFVDTPCPTCSGSGVATRPRVVKVRLPRGVKDGQQIRLKGKGGPGRNNGPSGDLYVRVHVATHDMFGRDGDHLLITVPVTYTEAVLGADVRVPTIDGDTVTIRIPPGTPPGRIFRVKSRGVTTESGRGDMLVTVDLVVPAELSAAERKAVEALRDVTVNQPRAAMGV